MIDRRDLSRRTAIAGARFLITGGASLVGSHIAEQLLAAGAAKVVLFDNFALGSATTVGYLLDDSRVVMVRGDITRVDDLMGALTGIDGVFAVAAFLTLPLSQNMALGLDVNIRGHLNVLQACKWSGVRKVVFSSSIGVYGNLGPGEVSEGQPFVTDGLQPAGAIYAATKIIGEQLCRLYSQSHGIITNSLRYANVYGERQHVRGVNSIPMIEAFESIRAGRSPVIEGDGLASNYYVYAGDAARANLLAMGGDVSGESFNILDEAPVSLRHIVETVLQACRSELPIEYVAPTSKVAFALQPGLKFSTKKAKHLLNWQPSLTIEEGIARLIHWCKSNT